MKYQVVTTEVALREADAAAAYIDAQGFPETSDEWLVRLAEAIDSLQKMPMRCPAAVEQQWFSKRGGVRFRQLVFGNYRIVFTVRKRDVVVLHVRHAAMPPMDPDEMG
jgi:plasmid stabilization system protein ParE